MAGVLVQIEACIPALRRYAMALARNRDDADDLVHDCLLRALERLHTIRNEAHVRSWLFTILHNLFVSRLRRAQRRMSEAGGSEQNRAAASLPPEQENRVQWGDLMRAVDDLAEDQRAVLLLVSVEGLSYAETANVLGVPTGTVMSRLARARERLRQAVEGEASPALRRVK
jgi:RNA polymerase sigma-70 factor (ECF subfamily)